MDDERNYLFQQWKSGSKPWKHWTRQKRRVWLPAKPRWAKRLLEFSVEWIPRGAGSINDPPGRHRCGGIIRGRGITRARIAARSSSFSARVSLFTFTAPAAKSGSLSLQFLCDGHRHSAKRFPHPFAMANFGRRTSTCAKRRLLCVFDRAERSKVLTEAQKGRTCTAHD